MDRNEIAAGDIVIVDFGGHTKHERHTVVTVGRVWVTTQREDTPGAGHRQRRFRLDTQRDPRSVGYGICFRTLAQEAVRNRAAAIGAHLDGQGITLKHDSPWKGREAELATLLGWTEP
jgi:hypothetical protein